MGLAAFRDRFFRKVVDFGGKKNFTSSHKVNHNLFLLMYRRTNVSDAYRKRFPRELPCMW